MKLQYSAMGSMGTIWIDCQDRFDEFVGRARSHHGHTADQIVDGLKRGCEINTGGAWDDAQIRDADSVQSIKKTVEIRELHACSECGQTGYAGQYPFSTIAGGSVCDDCL